MAKLTEKEISAIVQREIDAAHGYDGDYLSSKRAASWDAYNGIMPEPADGRSDAVSMDVHDTVNALMGQTQIIFKTSNVEIEADSEEDEARAEMESQLTVKEMERAGLHKALNSAAFTAFLTSNGWMKVAPEKKTVTQTEYFEVEPEMVPYLEQPTAPDQDVKVKKKGNGWEVKRTTRAQKLKIESIDAGSMLYAPDHDSDDIRNIRFIAQRKSMKVHELKALGIPRSKIERVPDYNENYYAGERSRKTDYFDDGRTDDSAQMATRQKEVYCCYILLDLYQNGDTELFYVLQGGQEMLSMEPVDFHPYITGSPIPIPQRVEGRGMYEVMIGVQDSKTAILRNFQDNLMVANGSRLAILDGAVNTKDALNGRINGVIRVSRPDAIQALPAQSVGRECIEGLNKWDDIRNARGGGSVDLTDANLQVMKSSAVAAAGQIESAEDQAGWYCQNIVQALLRGAFMLTHRTLREVMPGEIGGKLNGSYVRVDTREWPIREHVSINAGMTSKERRNTITALNAVMGLQAQAMQAGYEGEVIDKSRLHNTAVDLVKAYELGSPDMFFLDPDSEESQQAMQQKAQREQEAQAKAEQFTREQIALETAKLELERAKLSSENERFSEEMEFKYDELRMKTGTERAKVTSDSVLNMEKITQPARAGNE